MQKRKICLIELYGHSEVLYILYRLLRYDFEVSVFTNQAIVRDAKDYFEEELKNWYVQLEKESKEQFIKRHFSQLNEQHILIFITLISSYQFFANTTFRAKTIFVVHNVNTMLQSKEKLWLDKSSFQYFIFDLLRLARDKFQRVNFYKKKLLQSMDYISFASPTLSNYAKSITNEYDKKIIAPLPFGFYENEKEETQKRDTIIISVPGGVMQRARDYKMLYDVMAQVIPTTKKKVCLQLLGNSENESGKNIIEFFKKLESDNFRLVYFQQSLPQKEFDSFLRKTDFMILPLHKYRKSGLCQEECGLSFISGGLNDILRFGIPALVTKDYPVEKEVSPLIDYFEDKNELQETLQEWIDDSIYIAIRKRGKLHLNDFDQQKTAFQVVKILNDILSKNQDE